MGGFNIRAGDIQPVLSTVLTDADGVPVDLTGKTVTVNVKAMRSPYTFTTYTAVPDADQTANPGLAVYDWAEGGTETPGDYWLDWHVAGVLALPTVGYNRLTVWPSLADDGLPAFAPIVTLDDIEIAMGRALTDTEALRALQLIEELVSTIEGSINRVVQARRITESGTIPPTGKWYPNSGPLIALEALTVDDADVMSDYLSGSTWLAFRPGARWTATYVAGLGHDVLPGIAGVIRKAVSAVLLAPVQASSGVLQSYNVEGTSITYGPALTGGQGAVGRLAVADMNAVALRRKPVIG